MATHKIQLSYDDATGAVRVTHRATVDVGGHQVSHAEDVRLDDPEGAAAILKGLIDGNRDEMEQRAMAMAIDHVAAVQKKQRPGVKHLTVGGTLAAIGKIIPDKKD